VLANGLDDVYPSSNRRLAERILKSGGALLSEYPPGSPPLAHRFLERNRIISGLAQAVLIIEAPEHSGALATARFAVEQDRDLFVTPGAAENLNYRGSHRLIRDGATLVATPEEMLADMGLAPAAGAERAAADTPEEEKILAALGAAERPLTIDEIIEAATLTSSIVNRTLTVLVLKNAVREESGRYAIK
jgi:DNA processing protein